MGTPPVDPFSYHHPYLHQATKEFTISHWYSIFLTSALTINNSSLNHMLQHFSTSSGLEGLTTEINIGTSTHRYSHFHLSVEEGSSLHSESSLESYVTSKLKLSDADGSGGEDALTSESSASLSSNQTNHILAALNLTRLFAPTASPNTTESNQTQNELLDKDVETSNEPTNKGIGTTVDGSQQEISTVDGSQHEISTEESSLPELSTQEDPNEDEMNVPVNDYHGHHTFHIDELDELQDIEQMRNLPDAQNLTGKQLATKIIGAVGRMLHLPSRFNAQINRVSTNMHGTFLNFTLRKPLSLELHNRLMASRHMKIGNKTVAIRVISGPVEHLYVNLEKFTPENRFMMFLSFALGLLGVVVTIMIIIYLGARILHVENEEARHLIEHQGDEENEFYIDEQNAKPKPQPEISFINIESSPADLLLSPEMLHPSPHPTAAPLHINSCSSAPLLHPSPSSEPVFSSPGGPLSCLTAAAAANSLPLSLDLQQQPLV